MDALTESLLPFRYEHEQLGVFVFDPPAVWQAISLYGLLPYWTDADYLERIKPILADWLGPSGFLDALDERGLSWEARVVFVQSILRDCEPDRKDKPDSEGSEWFRQGDLSLMIAEYRHWYNTDPLRESWPYFLIQLQSLDQVKSDVALSNLSWYAAGKSEKALNSLMKRAGYAKRQSPDLPDAVRNIDFDAPVQLDNAHAIAQLGTIYRGLA